MPTEFEIQNFMPVCNKMHYNLQKIILVHELAILRWVDDNSENSKV